MKEQTLEQKYVKIDSVNPAPYNPRAITETAFAGLKESIKKFGFVDPLIINRATGNLIGGHQRLKAAEILGLEEVPAVFVDLTPIEEKALNVSLNNQEISGHFTDVLQDLLTEIKLELGTETLQELQLAPLEKVEWNSNIEQLAKIEGNLDGITSKIVLRCPQEGKGPFIEGLKAWLQEEGWDEVKID